MILVSKGKVGNHLKRKWGNWMYHIAIVDDDSMFCDTIKNYLENVGCELKLEMELSIWYTGEELYKHLKAGNQMDIIFLDIELVEKSGIWLGNMIREEFSDFRTAIVYISYEKNYALQLFQTQPKDFLVKPVYQEDVQRVIKRYLRENQSKKLQFLFKKGHKYCNMPYEDILYFQSVGRKIRIVAREEEEEFYGKLEQIKEQLPQQFIQIHKSYLVNENYIREYMYENVIMCNEEKLNISKPYRKLVQKKLLISRGEI
ncbi:MAG: LytTR family DNA-binding domain-containing protein [Lachnospiraceae bacterium]|nr:LytTR family DNA-binding domain-containing protein [Lachnospiraceae bacterium]